MSTRLTGGHAGYREAIDYAFTANVSNPSVVYSRREGFSCQSMHMPLDDDEIRIGEAHYCPDERSMSGSLREYNGVRVIVEAWEKARAKGLTAYQIADAVRDAELMYEYCD